MNLAAHTPIDRYALLCDPDLHELAAAALDDFAAQASQALAVEPLAALATGLAASVDAFASAGGRGCWLAGPPRRHAAEVASRLSERAELAVAANVLLRNGEAPAGWFGDVSEGIGLVRDIERNAGLPLLGKQVLLVGAGTTGTDVLGALLATRPARVVFASRSVGKAVSLAHRHQRWAYRYGVTLQTCAVAAADMGFDVVINATGQPLHEGATPLPAHVLARGALVLDTSPGAAARPFLAWAARQQARTRDGLGMLVEQLAEAFFIWRGQRPATAPVLARLRARLDADA